MAYEKVPKDYDQSKFQKLIDRITQVAQQGNKKVSDAVRDLSSSIDTKISSLEKKLGKRIDEATGDTPQLGLPVPQNLYVYEAGAFGFAFVNPFKVWKYRWHIRGYEFYGSPNSGFTPQEDPYSQSGTHYGLNGVNYLNTEDSITPSNTFVLSSGLIGKTIDNVTSGESGTVLSYGLSYPKFRIYARKSDLSYLTWNNGDIWRISEYPSNRLFSIGSQAIFFKRLGNFYVRARTLGWGHAYSAFTDEVASEGISSTDELPQVVIVSPVHSCGETCIMGTQADSENWGRPYCPTHGWVPWDEIISGTRELEHFVFFGVEFCSIELVWEAIELERRGVWYDVRHGTSKSTEEEIT